MISRECYTKEWYSAVSEQMNYHDLNLIERVVRAFSLLEMLSASGCPFIFKGGTSLMVLLGSDTHRLSIDIDIICPPGTDITKYLNNCQDYAFLSYEQIERVQRTNVPKSHCKLHYKVSFSDKVSATESAILLDVLYEDAQYSNVIKKPIISPFIRVEGEPLLVSVPSANDILGDKLTAYAPNTSGVPYMKNGNPACLQIAKQLYDIARLFDVFDDFDVVSSTFKRISEIELGYRNNAGNHIDVLDDIIKTSLCLSTRGAAGVGEIKELLDGVSRIRSHVFGISYSLESAITDAAKAACLAAAILTGTDAIIRFNPANVGELASVEINHDILSSKLNKLKKSNIEAFFYWAEADSMLRNRKTW
ncbi:MAG: nucleotidyl transferase AbiEii/AbiGii toxin family protein [Bacteroidales bacterium]|nr:nucleotidyl transferase AbiEii/AbiGii toxin family protein [Bacteroidales bacterium]